MNLIRPKPTRAIGVSGQFSRRVYPLQCSSDVLSVDRQRSALKESLRECLLSTNRGIFGLKSGLREKVLRLLSDLETLSPTPAPTQNLSKLSGEWSLLFSTITITGSRRTKLGLREFVSLGDFRQLIDTQKSMAANIIDFEVLGLGSLSGSLTIDAAYEVVSDVRVSIQLQKAVLEPEALQKLFEQNFDMLLDIFNPAGWLDVTYVDDTHRIGRDDKQNVFYLERVV